MNRIYQGKVSAVEIFDGKDEQDNPIWTKRDDWQEALWLHHEVFQDAVNYYLVALGALADPNHAAGNRVIRDLRSRLEDAWGQFPRSVAGEAVSLRKSIRRWLKLPESASVEHAFKAILKGNEAGPDTRAFALALLLDRCGGESAIQQGGRGYLPRFCDTNASPTYDFSETSLVAGKGKERLSKVLYSEPSAHDLLRIAEDLELSWTVKLQPGKFYSPNESASRLLEALDYISDYLKRSDNQRIKEIRNQFLDFERQFNTFKEKIKNFTWETGIPRNRKASKELTFATLVFKYFPCKLTAKILSLFIKKPATDSQKNSESGVAFASFGDDPIKLARGTRGYVFPAFTALPDWSPESPGEPTWKEFDIAAFKEALKSLNQFNQKTQERIENENNLFGQLAIMLGSEIKGWKPQKTESGEDEPPPEQLDPELFLLARDLERNLTEDLADTLVGEEKSIDFGEAFFKYRDGEWKFSSAALRGYRVISEEWNKLRAKFGEDLTSDQLEEIVKNYQREEKNRKSVGSIPLFLRLCEKKYWPLWQTDNQETEEPNSGQPFLHKMVSFHIKFRDFQRSREPINLTPAEPTHSRRLYMFSDIKDKEAKVAFEKAGNCFTVECAIAMQTEAGRLREQRVRLHYSAKRLLRDELQGKVESRWLQPMTRALGLKIPEGEPKSSFESAVSLMPDIVRQADASESKKRFLLNFPVTLDPSWIRSGLKKSAIWNGQFNGIRDKKLHLHWPDTIKGKGSESPWWENEQIINQGFTCISVDLGQRTAGAWALLRITCLDPQKGPNGTRRPVREIGSDGKRSWFAEVVTTGILRLPGEDQKVMDSKGSLNREQFGKAGRNALLSEWEHAKKLAGDLLADDPEAWVGKRFNGKSFPEQNDALISLANRRLSRLNTFHRWSCFDPDRPEVAARRDNMILKLIEELSHWQDTEVSRWKEFVEKGDFASFRSVSGAAFESLRQALGVHLVALANRVAPLRNRSWKWELSRGSNEQGVYGELLDTGARLAPQPTWIRGQRGLSLSRVEQLEGLRRLFLRYNRSFDREPGKPAKFGSADLGRKSGEPCRLLLEKIDRIKEQRINQTAHLILTEALGIKLKPHQIDPIERKEKDIHGEYEKIPNREPVDFIVIENLDRYLTSQGRAPAENSRLMKWAHRAVRDKIKMLAEEPFGIPVVETAAAYSSRFCAITSIAGARCEERANLDDYLKDLLENRANRKPKPGQPNPADFRELLNQFTLLEKLNAYLKQARDEGKKKGKSPYSLFLPKQGGPLFLAIDTKNGKHKLKNRIPKQADINAAINIGLRAIAAPHAFEILHKVRTQKDGGEFKPIPKNAREKATFTGKSLITLNDKPSDNLLKAKSPNFFFDARAFDCFDSGYLTQGDQKIPITSGIGLWATVNKLLPNQLIIINRHRLERWQQEIAIEEDISM